MRRLFVSGTADCERCLGDAGTLGTLAGLSGYFLFPFTFQLFSFLLISFLFSFTFLSWFHFLYDVQSECVRVIYFFFFPCPILAFVPSPHIICFLFFFHSLLLTLRSSKTAPALHTPSSTPASSPVDLPRPPPPSSPSFPSFPSFLSFPSPPLLPRCPFPGVAIRLQDVLKDSLTRGREFRDACLRLRDTLV